MPIDIATGHVELAREDFVLPGRVPLNWTRHFRATLLDSSAFLAPGWTTSLLSSLRRVGKEWHFISGEGDVHVFADPDENIVKGHPISLPGACLELVRRESQLIVTRWDVDSGQIERFVFGAERTRGVVTLFLAGVEDVSGDGLRLTRDASGRLIELHQRIENRTVVINYSPAARVESLALVSRGRQTRLVGYEYDALGHLSAAIDRRGLANRYEYDAHSRITREVLKDGAAYSYRYDDQGRCVRFSGLDRYNEKRLKFLDTARTTVVTDSYGKSSAYEYLPSGQITSETNPSGHRRITTFDEYNRIVAKVDPTGATTQYTYDAAGNRDSITNPLGHIHRFSFNSHHQPVSVTDPSGKTWQRQYDLQQRLIASQDPLGARWELAYDESGNLATIRDPLGATRHLRHIEGVVAEMTDWMGHATRFAWDEFGRVVERIGPVGERTAFRYDLAGNPVEAELPDGRRLHATYDSGGNLSSFTNATGHTTRLRYGPCRRLVERVDPMGRAVRYGWGTEPQRLESVSNEKGEVFRYFRDDQGRIVRERSFDGREQTFTYDPDGRPIAFTNGNDETVRIDRDAAGNLVKEIFADGTIADYEYDPVGRMAAAVNADIAVRFEYDDAGRLVRECQGDDWVRTEYNASGEVVLKRTSLGHDVRYELDANGRVRTLVTGDKQTLAFERDARGLETGREMPGGIRLEQRFDSMGRLLEQRVARTPVSVLSGPGASSAPRISAGHDVVKRYYGYDADGLLLSVKDGRWGATDYNYDPAERLVSVFRDSGADERFSYDETDNLVQLGEKDQRSPDQTCSYGPGNRLVRRGDTLYEHDTDGRLVRKTEYAASNAPQVWDYSWNAQGELRQLRRPDGAVWRYKYDALGRRISKEGPTSCRSFLWDRDGVIQEKLDREHAVAWISKQNSFAPLAKVQNGAVYSIITDHLGTPREMIDSFGALVWAASFAAWGLEERKHTPRPEHECAIRFQGQWFDEESGLHYSRFRYYDPTIGRFITPDPTRLGGGVNLYQYVRNPINWIDPFGLNGSDCVDLTDDKARKHILEGDDTGGGHRPGTGKPNKSEFPASWSDDKILTTASDIATDPAQRWSPPDSRGYTTSAKSVDGVDVKVVYDTRNDRIVTAFPTNQPRNPP